MKVIGLDLSLTGTGICWGDRDYTTVKTKRSDQDGRFVVIRDHVRYYARGADLAMIEGIAFGSHKAIIAGMVHAVVRVALMDLGIQWALVNPKALKGFATGSTESDKDAMRAAMYDRTDEVAPDDNQVDAWWLRMMGLDYVGAMLPGGPALPERRAYFHGIAWPDLPQDPDRPGGRGADLPPLASVTPGPTSG